MTILRAQLTTPAISKIYDAANYSRRYKSVAHYSITMILIVEHEDEAPSLIKQAQMELKNKLYIV